MVKNSLPEWMARESETEEETGACRDYDDFFSRTKYTVPEGGASAKPNLHALTDLPPKECEGAFPKENGRMEAFNNDLVIRYLDRVVVKDDGYEVLVIHSVLGEAMVLACFLFRKFSEKSVEISRGFCFNLFVLVCNFGG